jgi:hypothetical protein
VRYSLDRRDGSRSHHMGIKRLFKFKWMHKMFDLTRYQKDHTCRKRTCLLPSVSLVMLQSLSICDKRRSLVVRYGFPWTDWNFPKVHKDDRSSGTSQKAQNRKAGCFILLKRITKLKCVNSEVTSVHILPKQGCPRLAPWHHVGAPIEVTLDKKWIIRVIRWELNPSTSK